jgi:hypothetical protein
MSSQPFSQAVEKDLQLRARIVQTRDVPQRVRLGPSLAAVLLGGLFDQPAKHQDHDTVLMSAADLSPRC